MPLIFVGLSAWSMSYAKAVEVMNDLGPGYRAVSPATLASLLAAHGGLS